MASFVSMSVNLYLSLVIMEINCPLLLSMKGIQSVSCTKQLKNTCKS